MCTPTTGSPTITLCQLRPNYHLVSNPPKTRVLRDLSPIRQSVLQEFLTLRIDV